ncbi:hypothetical protein EVG20_g2337 [Dentipellis fragilis]|uniref:Uncharacterized protein n=1 Tax=Dentipellis fragilis TaxID=205917 RepID=A0A4Y9Z7E1_9AGAM|nr:hypothetical protein EVG20_g2337 [Dentipellis fragilis]
MPRCGRRTKPTGVNVASLPINTTQVSGSRGHTQVPICVNARERAKLLGQVVSTSDTICAPSAPAENLHKAKAGRSADPRDPCSHAPCSMRFHGLGIPIRCKWHPALVWISVANQQSGSRAIKFDVEHMVVITGSLHTPHIIPRWILLDDEPDEPNRASVVLTVLLCPQAPLTDPMGAKKHPGTEWHPSPSEDPRLYRPDSYREARARHIPRNQSNTADNHCFIIGCLYDTRYSMDGLTLDISGFAASTYALDGAHSNGFLSKATSCRNRPDAQPSEGKGAHPNTSSSKATKTQKNANADVTHGARTSVFLESESLDSTAE